jgi:HlyD family secretion protein
VKARLIVLVAAAAAAVGVWRLIVWRNQPPEVTFARAVRETLVSTVSTNGKVEPIELATARAEGSGAVLRILIQEGQTVSQGQPLVEIDAAQARAELASAQARMAQVRAELETLEKGGRAAELAEIASGVERARLDLETAQKEYDTLVRLQAKQAATAVEVAAAKEKVDRARLQIASLEKRRAALVAPPDKASAQARYEEAESSARLAETKIQKSLVRAPIAGAVYQFDLKPGAFLNAGDEVAKIGRLERVRVAVYVDEPDLGRVAKGMPVTITWDAMPGHQWTGAVDRMPTEIVALGARQVGEVICIIENPQKDLLPGTNVNVEIRTQVAENIVAIPKEALLREGGKTGVYVLDGDRVAWREVTLGVNNTTRTQVHELRDGDAVALPSDRTLTAGMSVRPVFQ